MTSQQRIPVMVVSVFGIDDIIRDASGNYIAPPQPVIYPRPDGPWNQNAPVQVVETVDVVCAWCPDFDASDPKNANVSHGMCSTCLERESLGWAA